MSKSSPVSAAMRTNRIAGFTLVEMLVSVAIVLLMMSMFAQIFQMATGSLSQQRGIAENDQRGRMLTTTLRGDLERRTFRDILPFRANDDGARPPETREGYFEIDENDPSDDTDDVLSFTASVHNKLSSKDSSPFTGRAQPLSGVAITGVTSSTITLAGDYSSRIALGSRIWIVASSGSSGITNDGRYVVASTTPPGSGPTTITIDINVPPNLVVPSLNTSVTQLGGIYLSESDPEFGDGRFGNDSSVSGTAEVCYFLRNSVLYRRVLLIREPESGADAQPNWSTGSPILWNSPTLNANYPPSGTSTTFWRDFDFSAFYFSGTTITNSSGTTTTHSPGVRFHSAPESLSNSSSPYNLLTFLDLMASPPTTTLVPISLGIPHLRFGHSTTTGLPQDGSSSSGGNVTFRRFNLQECSHSAFGYPGYVPGAGNPMNRTDLIFPSPTGLVTQYSGETWRRGEDILMSNVLSFDVKVWDPVSSAFVDVGNGNGGPLSSTAPVVTVGGNVVGGRLNTTYGPNGHYRFDTWHPKASVGGGLYDNEPPFIPVDAISQPFALSAIQITINYRDISSGQIRQVTIVQSLVDPRANNN